MMMMMMVEMMMINRERVDRRVRSSMMMMVNREKHRCQTKPIIQPGLLAIIQVLL